MKIGERSDGMFGVAPAHLLKTQTPDEEGITLTRKIFDEEKKIGDRSKSKSLIRTVMHV